MIRHYLTFAQQAAQLDAPLANRTLAECWSQEKNRLLLRFIEDRDSLFVEIALDLQLGYALLRKEVHRARKNTIDFFHGLIGAQLQSVSIDDGERLIRFHFADGRQLIAFFFGKGSGNVVVFDNTITDAFQDHSEEYLRLLQPTDSPVHTKAELMAALRASDKTPAAALASVLPEFGKRLSEEAVYRTGTGELPLLSSATDEQLHNLLITVDTLYQECTESDRFYVYTMPDDVVFTLTEFKGLAISAERVEVFNDIGKAIQAFRNSYFKTNQVSKLRTMMAKRLQTSLGKLERLRQQRRTGTEQLQYAAEWEATGNLLLAHLHEIEKGGETVTLTDWEGSERTVRLDPMLTPAENTERYFRKARNARDDAAHAEERRMDTEREIARVQQLARIVQDAETPEELNRVLMENNDLFAQKGEAKEKGTAERFRRFTVDGGYEVYAGKNATNNDELTVRFAKPNDYWFHARGSSGSHVVLRWNDAKTKPPKRTLEDAASIAAYYSGAKNAKLVPVAFTLKKYVRKPKGAAVGAVIMEREKVVMVEPKLPAEA